MFAVCWISRSSFHLFTKTHIPKAYFFDYATHKLICEEGNAKILSPKTESVFYNPSMVTNRDLTIGVIQNYHEMLDELTHNKKLVKKSERESEKTKI